MEVLAWLAFPLSATAVAMCWAAWRGRRSAPRRNGPQPIARRRGGAFASVDDFRRFTEALIGPGPSASSRRANRRSGRRVS